MVRVGTKHFAASLAFWVVMVWGCSAWAAGLYVNQSVDTIARVEIEIAKDGAAATVVPGIYEQDSKGWCVYRLDDIPSGVYTFRARWATAESMMSDWSMLVNGLKITEPTYLIIK